MPRCDRCGKWLWPFSPQLQLFSADGKLETRLCPKCDEAGVEDRSNSKPQGPDTLVLGEPDPTQPFTNQTDVTYITPEADRRRMHSQAVNQLGLAEAIVASDTGSVRSLLQQGVLSKVRELPVSRVAGLIQELVQIGGKPEGFIGGDRSGGAFNEQQRHARAREIGEELYLLGGGGEPELMCAVYYFVKAKCGSTRARGLSFAWHGVGNNAWLA